MLLTSKLGPINYLHFFGCLTEFFAVLCSSSFLAMIQNQTRFIILWLITNHCGDTAAQKINDVNFNDKVILNGRMPATCTQS